MSYRVNPKFSVGRDDPLESIQFLAAAESFNSRDLLVLLDRINVDLFNLGLEDDQFLPERAIEQAELLVTQLQACRGLLNEAAGLDPRETEIGLQMICMLEIRLKFFMAGNWFIALRYQPAVHHLALDTQDAVDVMLEAGITYLEASKAIPKATRSRETLLPAAQGFLDQTPFQQYPIGLCFTERGVTAKQVQLALKTGIEKCGAAVVNVKWNLIAEAAAECNFFDWEYWLKLEGWLENEKLPDKYPWLRAFSFLGLKFDEADIDKELNTLLFIYRAFGEDFDFGSIDLPKEAEMAEKISRQNCLANIAEKGIELSADQMALLDARQGELATQLELNEAAFWSSVDYYFSIEGSDFDIFWGYVSLDLEFNNSWADSVIKFAKAGVSPSDLKATAEKTRLFSFWTLECAYFESSSIEEVLTFTALIDDLELSDDELSEDMLLLWISLKLPQKVLSFYWQNFTPAELETMDDYVQEDLVKFKNFYEGSDRKLDIKKKIQAEGFGVALSDMILYASFEDYEFAWEHEISPSLMNELGRDRMEVELSVFKTSPHHGYLAENFGLRRCIQLQRDYGLNLDDIYTLHLEYERITDPQISPEGEFGVNDFYALKALGIDPEEYYSEGLDFSSLVHLKNHGLLSEEHRPIWRLCTGDNVNAISVFKLLVDDWQMLNEFLYEQGLLPLALIERLTPRLMSQALTWLRNTNQLKTKAASFLDHYNLSFAVNYPIFIIEDMWEAFETDIETTKPRALVIESKTDWNQSSWRKDPSLVAIAENYHVTLIEAGTVADLDEVVARAASDKSFDLLYLHGHGNPEVLDLSFYPRPNGDDRDARKALIKESVSNSALKTITAHLKPDAKTILRSCSVGKETAECTLSIAGHIAAQLPGTVFAPAGDMSDIKPLFDENGIVTKVNFLMAGLDEVDSVQFENGKMM